MTAGIASLVLVAALLHASWNALLRGGRDRFWSASVMAFAGGVAGAFVACFVPLPARASWICIAISALVHIVYHLLLVRMYREGDLGHTYPIARGSSPLLIALGGWLLAAEQLGATTIAGVVLVCAGIFTLALGGAAQPRQIGAALATGCAIAIYSVTDGLGVRLSDNAVAYTAWMVIGYGLPMPVVYWLLRRGRGEVFWRAAPRDFGFAVGGGLVAIGGYGVVIYAMEHAPLGPVSALRETSVLFAVLLGCFFLRERFTWRKALSSLLIVIGAICLNAG